MSGLVDTATGRLLDVVPDRIARAVADWLARRGREWLDRIGVVVLDAHRGYPTPSACTWATRPWWSTTFT